MVADHTNCVPLKEHLEALRAADQRALELLARSNADRIKTGTLIVSIMVAIASLVVAVVAVAFKH